MSNDVRIAIGAVDNASAVFKQVGASALTLQNQAASMAGALKSSIAGIAAGFTVMSIADSVKQSISAMAALDDAAEKTGASVEKLSAAFKVAKISGIDTALVEQSLVKLSKTIAEAGDSGSEAAKALKAIGLAQKDLVGIDTVDALKKVADGMDRYADGSGKTALSLALLGKAGADALPYLKDLAAETELVGKISGEQAAMAEQFEKNWAKLSARMGGVGKQIAAELLPSLLDATEAMLKFGKAGGGGEAVNIGWLDSMVDRASIRLNELSAAFDGARAAMFRSIGASGLADAAQKEADLAIAALDRIARRRVQDAQAAARDADKAVGSYAPKDKPQANFGGASGNKPIKEGNPYAAAQEGAKEWAKYIEAADKATAGLTAETENWSKAEARIVALVSSSAWAEYSAEMKRTALMKFDAEQAAEDLAKTLKALEQETKDLTKTQEEHEKAMRGQLNAVLDHARAAELELENYGRTRAEIEATNIARLEEELAIERSLGSRADLVDNIEQEIAARKRALAAMRGVESLDAGKKAAEESARAWENFSRDIESSLTDALYRSFEAGDDFGETFAKNLERTFKAMALKAAVQYIVDGTGALVGAGVNYLTNGSNPGRPGVTSALSAASDAYSAYQGGSLAYQWATGTMSTANVGGTMFANATGTGLDGLLATNGAYGTAAEGAAGGLSSASAVGGVFAVMAAILIDDILAGMESEAATITSVRLGARPAGDYRGYGASVDSRFGTYTADQSGRGGEALAAGLATALAGRSGELAKAFDFSDADVTKTSDSVKRFFAAVDSWQTTITEYADQQLGEVSGSRTELLSTNQRIAGYQGSLEVAAIQTIIDDQLSALGQTFLSAVDTSFAKNFNVSALELGTFDSVETFVTAARIDMLQAIKTADVDGLFSEAFQAIGASIENADASAITAAFAAIGGTVASYEALITKAKNLDIDAEGIDLIKVGKQIGAEKLSAQMDAYYTAFFDEEEQAAARARQLGEAWKDSGIAAAIPDTKEGFRSIVESLQLNTEEGRKTFISLMSLAPAFADVTAAATETAKAAQKAAEEQLKTAADLQARLVARYTDPSVDAALAEFKAAGIDTTGWLSMLPAALQKMASDTVGALDPAIAGNRAYLETLNNLSPAFDVIIAETERMAAALQNTLTAAAERASASLATIEQYANQRTAALETERGAELKSIEQAIARYNDQQRAAEAAAQRLDRLYNALSGTRDQLTGGLSFDAASDQLTAALMGARSGRLPELGTLQPALSAVGKISVDDYASRVDFDRARLTEAGKVAELGDLAKTSLDHEKATIDLMETLVKSSEEARVSATERYDLMIEGIQDSVDIARDQLNALLNGPSVGLAESVKTLAQNMATLASNVGTRDAAMAVSNVVTEGKKHGVDFKSGYSDKEIRDYANTLNLSESASGDKGGYTAYSQAIANGVSAKELDEIMGWSKGTANKWATSHGLPRFATGGSFSGGLRLVGENGPELEVTGPSRIYNAEQTRQMMAGDGGVTAKNLQAIIAELVELRALMRATALHTHDTKQALQRVMPDGDALQTRAAA